MSVSMKTLVAMGLVVAASAGASPAEEKLVHKIRSTPGVLWRAEVGAMQGRSLKTLAGVNAESWGAVQKLPKADSKIADEDIPDTFDSETNWPKCAKVIGDIRDQSMCGCCCELFCGGVRCFCSNPEKKIFFLGGREGGGKNDQTL
jgi:hypothetical protein